MIDGRLRRIARPLTRAVRAGLQRWDAVGVRRRATRALRGRGDWTIGPIRRAKSGTRIAHIRSAGLQREAILKITDTSAGARGLTRERLVLTKLATDSRLDDLRQFFPEVLEAGTDGRWSYFVQSTLPGVPATASVASNRQHFFSEASSIALRLHATSGAQEVVTADQAQEWVERPLEAMGELVDRRLGSDEARSIDRLAAEVGSAIDGATVHVGWIHGDLWSDNILVDARGGGVTGIVDWDSASDVGLAVHDQLHLVLYARKVLAGTEIGTEICRALGSDAQWETWELPALSAGTDGLPGSDAASRMRLGVVLYWLRLVTLNLERQPMTTRSRRWVDNNVRAVLACL